MQVGRWRVAALQVQPVGTGAHHHGRLPALDDPLVLVPQQQGHVAGVEEGEVGDHEVEVPATG